MTNTGTPVGNEAEHHLKAAVKAASDAVDHLAARCKILEQVEHENFLAFDRCTARRLIFLDTDGVLNSTAYWHRMNRDVRMGTEKAFDPDAVERLNRIIDETGAELVASSAWRGEGNNDDVCAMMRLRGFRHSFIGCTPRMPSQEPDFERWNEIQHWFYANVSVAEVEAGARFVVIDDDRDAWNSTHPLADIGTFIHTDYKRGLLDPHVDLAIQWLRGDA